MSETAESFRRHVVGYAGSAPDCTTCGHPAKEHSMEGCHTSGCKCYHRLTWVASGMDALGLPPDYKFAEEPHA